MARRFALSRHVYSPIIPPRSGVDNYRCSFRIATNIRLIDLLFRCRTRCRPRLCSLSWLRLRPASRRQIGRLRAQHRYSNSAQCAMTLMVIMTSHRKWSGADLAISKSPLPSPFEISRYRSTSFGAPRPVSIKYAVGIFLCPVAALISGRKSHFTPDISKRPRYIS